MMEPQRMAVGPGLGRSDFVTDVVADYLRRPSSPMVVDADALFALAQRTELLSNRRPAGAHSAPGRIRAAHRKAAECGRRESKRQPP